VAVVSALNTQPPRFPDQCVVDASVLIKAVLPEPDSDLALALLASTNLDARAAPDFVFLECGSVLSFRVHRRMLTLEVAQRNLSTIYDVRLTIHPTGTLVRTAFTLAATLGISIYDAAYVALADLLHIPLITADEALARQIAGPLERVRTLASFRQP
jgi:predicted nucleic acid-binding protein